MMRKFLHLFSRDSKPTILSFVLIATAVGVILSWGFGAFVRAEAEQPHVVAQDPNIIDQPTLPENVPGEIEVRSDLSIFDLRNWKAVPTDLTYVEPVSPVNYANYLRIIKHDSVDYLYAHYATSGLRIDLQCVTHPYHTLRRRERKSVDIQRGFKEYRLAVDISKEPVGKVFPVVVQATYWNGFRKASEEDASTYVDDHAPLPEDLALLVLYPTSKPCQSLRLETASHESDDWVPYLNPVEAFRDPRGEYAYWNVRDKRPDYHYRMTWKW